MTPFVLVHGAFHGGWCWKCVTRRLRDAGHSVYAPTLTGLGDREHLLDPSVNLSTHIQDVVNVLVYEDLHNVPLVGHSYAGMVIAGVAEAVPARLSRLIYLDAVIPVDGDCTRRGHGGAAADHDRCGRRLNSGGDSSPYRVSRVAQC